MNLQLSDGTTMQIPDDATPEMIKNFAARGEAYAKSNPVTPAPQENDPYSARNTTGRVATDMLLGIPDLAIAASNVISKPGDWIAEKITGERPVSRDLPTLAPMLREKLNVAELPEDAPWYRRIGESAASSLTTGVAGIARAVAGGLKASVTGGLNEGGKELLKNTVVPTVTSDAGARVGGAIGGADRRADRWRDRWCRTLMRPAASNWVQGRYVGKGDPNAPQIAAAAERLGIEPTAGALGNYDIQKRENAFAANRPGGLASREQARIRSEMTGAGENIAQQRGGTGGGQARSATTSSELQPIASCRTVSTRRRSRRTCSARSAMQPRCRCATSSRKHARR